MSFDEKTYKRKWVKARWSKHLEKCRLYRRSFFGKIVSTYIQMKRRVLGRSKSRDARYIGLPLCEKSWFYDWAQADKKYKNIYTKWVRSGYKLRLCPSIDRIKNNCGYVTGNIQWLTLSDNTKKKGRIL